MQKLLVLMATCAQNHFLLLLLVWDRKNQGKGSSTP